MKKVAFDTETFLINKVGKATTKTVPRLVCLSVAEEDETPFVHERKRAVHTAKALFERDDCVLFGHNVVFDLLVCARAISEELGEDMVPRFFELYSEGRIRDTLVREKLYDISNGGCYRRGGYGLKDLVKRRLGKKLTGKSGADAWRMRYNELDGIPAESYPAAAYEYALLDAVYTLQVAIDQGEWICNEDFQAGADFCLSLASAWGVRCDPEWAGAVDGWYAKLEALALERLQRIGLATKSGRVPRKKRQALVEQAFAGIGEQPTLTKTGQISTASKVMDYLEKKGYDDEQGAFQALQDYSRARKFRSTYLEPLLDAGESGQPLCPRYNVLVDSGRTSSSGPNIQNLVSRINPRERRALQWLELEAGEKLSPLDRLGHEAGFAVGPDIRGAIVPRPGKIFVSADYSAIEMAGLAQVIRNWTGELAALGKSINAHEDQHLRIVAAMRGIPYERALELHEDYKAAAKEGRPPADPLIDFDRFLGKCFHPDTEVLTLDGWVRIEDLEEGAHVAAAEVHRANHAGSVDIRFQAPVAYYERDDYNELVHVDSQDMKLAVTHDHRIPCWTRQGKFFSEEAGSGFWEADRQVACAGWCRAGVESEVDLGILRLAVALQADGSITSNGAIRFGFTKKRKADRLRRLLDVADVEYTSATPQMNSKQGYRFYISRESAEPFASLLNEDKTFPMEWLYLSLRERIVVLEELALWDSTVIRGGRSYHYSSACESNIDIVSAIAAMTGRKAKQLPVEIADNPLHADIYSVAIADRAESCTGNYKIERRPYSGKVYCLTVPADAILVRYRGATSIVHQSANYGFAGGASAETWVEFTAGMGADVDLETGEKVRAAWFKAWPEMNDVYFPKIGDMRMPGGDYYVEQHGPDRMTKGWRTRITDRFTSAANSPFQGIVADGAKYAAWLLQTACYTQPGSALYGARVVIFEHDSFTLECDEDHGDAVGKELSRLMVEGMSLFLPDIEVEADYDILEDRWGK